MIQLEKQIMDYQPYNEQESRDRAIMLDFLREGKHPFSRENEMAHFTASAWIVNPSRTKVLMVFHNIYQSWSWTGGHADGETDLLAVACREAREETGVIQIHPVTSEIYSLETLMVAGHEKRGKYIPCHIHMNVTFLLETDENEVLRIKPDENSGVGWIDIGNLPDKVSEPWMLERIYTKLNQKLLQAVVRN